MPIINFYIRSRNVRPHVNGDGQVHVCVSDWGRIMYRLSSLNAHNDEPERAQEQLREIVRKMRNPTSGTLQAHHMRYTGRTTTEEQQNGRSNIRPEQPLGPA